MSITIFYFSHFFAGKGLTPGNVQRKQAAQPQKAMPPDSIQHSKAFNRFQHVIGEILRRCAGIAPGEDIFRLLEHANIERTVKLVRKLHLADVLKQHDRRAQYRRWVGILGAALLHHARRGAMELIPGCVINLGIGIPSGVGIIANEEGIAATLSLESGPIGGVPLEGTGFAGSMNPENINSICDTFDLYDGGFLDMTFLGAAEIDERGNVNVSKFGNRCPGPGGFINISQNTPKVFFMGGFTAGKQRIEVTGGKLNIIEDGPKMKFIKEVQQITFSADYARGMGQEVTYITERAVFRLTGSGIMLTEIAPGVELERDILAHMGFCPLIAEDLKVMDGRIFREGKMGLENDRAGV